MAGGVTFFQLPPPPAEGKKDVFGTVRHRLVVMVGVAIGVTGAGSRG